MPEYPYHIYFYSETCRENFPLIHLYIFVFLQKFISFSIDEVTLAARLEEGGGGLKPY